MCVVLSLRSFQKQEHTVAATTVVNGNSSSEEVCSRGNRARQDPSGLEHTEK